MPPRLRQSISPSAYRPPAARCRFAPSLSQIARGGMAVFAGHGSSGDRAGIAGVRITGAGPRGGGECGRRGFYRGASYGRIAGHGKYPCERRGPAGFPSRTAGGRPGDGARLGGCRGDRAGAGAYPRGYPGACPPGPRAAPCFVVAARARRAGQGPRRRPGRARKPRGSIGFSCFSSRGRNTRETGMLRGRRASPAGKERWMMAGNRQPESPMASGAIRPSRNLRRAGPGGRARAESPRSSLPNR